MSSTVTLNRLEGDAGGFSGELLVDDEHMCYTIELPWKGNAQDVSCIPAGRYHLSMIQSPHFGCLMPHILDVPGRTAEELHAVNNLAELLGCVGLGDVPGPGYTLAYPAHPAQVRFNAWMESVGGTALLVVNDPPQGPFTILPPAPPTVQTA